MTKAKDIIKDGFNIEDALIIKEAIKKELETNECAVIDFFGIDLFTASFFNTCIGEFIIANSLGWFNNHIRFVNLNAVGEVLCKQAVDNWARKFNRWE